MITEDQLPECYLLPLPRDFRTGTSGWVVAQPRGAAETPHPWHDESLAPDSLQTTNNSVCDNADLFTVYTLAAQKHRHVFMWTIKKQEIMAGGE